MTTVGRMVGCSVLLSMVFAARGAQADVRPAALFTDGVVIQQDAQVAIWGWADAHEDVTVTASWGAHASATADAEGKWLLRLETPRARVGTAPAYELSFQANNTVQVNDVLVGEVWLASGQSNMSMMIDRLRSFDAQSGDASLAVIREYKVAKTVSPARAADTKGHWMKASGDSIGSFSATAFFFARHLNDSLGVPVGIVNASWGGTPIESWFAKDLQESHDVTMQTTAAIDEFVATFDAEKSKIAFEATIAEWEADRDAALAEGREFMRGKPRERTPATYAQRYPGNLYAGMIHPLIPYTFKGAIWYQGEANVHNVEQAKYYETQIGQLITSWRADFENPTMPFYMVQLSGFRAPQVHPVEHEQFRPVHREAMRKASRDIEYTGLASAVDIGDAKDLHPTNKMEVGRRLALLALRNEYGRDVVPSGPLLKSFDIEGGSILLDFDHRGDGLVARGEGALSGFAIAGADGNYVWADAEIVERCDGWRFWQKKQLVVVSSPAVGEPTSVKYGWADNPTTSNLYNSEGLPASPFSTN